MSLTMWHYSTDSAYFLLLWRCNSEWPTLNTLAVRLVVRLSHDTDYSILPNFMYTPPQTLPSSKFVANPIFARLLTHRHVHYTFVSPIGWFHLDQSSSGTLQVVPRLTLWAGAGAEKWWDNNEQVSGHVHIHYVCFAEKRCESSWSANGTWSDIQGKKYWSYYWSENQDTGRKTKLG